MAGELGMEGAKVHEKAQTVLAFWFALSMKQQFAKDAALDREIADRFGATRDEVFASGASGWRDHPGDLLAAIVLLDQFSRNIHRDTSKAFEADELARSLTASAIEKGWDTQYPVDRRAFLYMPLMHAEDAALQELSVEKFTGLGNADNLKYARDHAAVIARFGRFPSRNAALGRASTPEERAFLSRSGAGW